MTITQHHYIYNIHTLNFNFGGEKSYIFINAAPNIGRGCPIDTIVRPSANWTGSSSYNTFCKPRL